MALVATILAGGCSMTGSTGAQAPALSVSCLQQVQPEQQVQLDLVDSLMARSQPYAALAQLENEGLSTEQHWLRFGQLQAATRQLKQAEKVFQSLVSQCRTAEGYHGLGLVYLKQGQLEQGLELLAQARQLTPSSADIRNDYGYALLLIGRMEEAVFELRTAFELADGQGVVRQNLAAVYLLMNDTTGLSLLKNKYDFGLEEYAHAERLKAEIIRKQQ